MFETFLLCWLLAASPGQAGDAPAYRDLRVRVVDEAGRPVPSVQVFLGGLERYSVDPEEVAEEPERYPGLVFRTDGRGGFTARFGRFKSHQVDAPDGFQGPGYGAYHFFLSKPGWAGGVSRLVLNLDAEELEDYRSNRRHEPRPAPGDHREWQRGEFAPLVLTDSPPTRPLVIVLKRGLEVAGRLVDGQGRGLPGRKVEVSLDLHHGSHTGAGGEIFVQEATTDAAGRFRLPHVYPNLFRLWPSWTETPACWIKTQVRGRWSDRVVDYVVPHLGTRRRSADYERRIALRLVLVSRSPYRYFGRVTNLEGKPVVGGTVTVGTSLHDPPDTWGDFHGTGERTTTHGEGWYALRTGSRFGRWISAEVGDWRSDVPNEGDRTLPPGRYDIQLGSAEGGVEAVPGMAGAQAPAEKPDNPFAGTIQLDLARNKGENFSGWP